jgi:predicted transglutaminase-like cysteine proteinase
MKTILASMLIAAAALIPNASFARDAETLVVWESAKRMSGDIATSWKLFCLREPGECTQQEGKDVVPFEVAREINWRVNRSVQYVSDQQHFGVRDYWTTVRDGMGDCEDFALTKRQMLRRMGFSSSSMRMVALQDRDSGGEGHAVLVVRTDRGDMVLDNMSDYVDYPSELDMTIVAIEHKGELYALDHIEARSTAGQVRVVAQR